MATRYTAREDVLSISIVTYQIDPAAFRHVLRSLDRAITRLQELEAAPVSVRLIDNGDQQALLEQLAAESFRAPDLDYDIIGGLGNIGYGRAHNLAILTTHAPYHLILNPDVELAPDCLVAGLDYLRGRDGVSAVAPHATDGEGHVQFLCKRFPNVLDLLLRGFAPAAVKRLFRRRLARYELHDMIHDRAVEGVPLISGCYMLCDTALLKRAGGFNERFFLYFEDYALSMELKKYGALAYLPDMRIRHYGGNSARKGLRHIVMFARSGIRFFNTYGWKLL